MWMRDFGGAQSGVELALCDLLDRVSGNDSWPQMVKDYQVDAVLSVTASGDGQGFSFSHEVLVRLAALGIPLEVELWTERPENKTG